MKKMIMGIAGLLCLQSGVGYAATNEHTRAEIGARHVAAGKDGKGYGAIYAEWEIVPLLSIGTNKTRIAAKLGPPYPVSDRYVPEGGTYSETHDTFEARWRITYSHDDRPLTIERALIVKDAEANKASEVTARKPVETHR
jgi:hypothetical protein